MISLSRIPFKNIQTHPVRNALLAGLTLVQTASLIFILFLLCKMKGELSLAQERFGADIIVYPYVALTKISSKKLLMQGTPVCSYLPRSSVKRLAECEHIQKISYQLYIKDETGEEPVWIVGVDEDSDFVISPWISGTNRKIPAEGEVLAGAKVPAPEGQVRLFQQDYPLAARLDKTGSELDSMLFVSLETLQLLIARSKELGISSYKSVKPFKQFSSVLIKTEGEQYVEGVNHWINLHVRKVIATRSAESLVAASSGIHTNLGLVIGISVGISLILLVALFIAQNMLMKERKKEFFVWYTAGCSVSLLQSLMMKESFFVHLGGALVGTLLSLACIMLFGQAGLSLSGLFPWLLLMLFLSVSLSSLSSATAVHLATRSLSGQMLVAR